MMPSTSTRIVNTAAKCHYCAHRTEIGLEPACVVVCPEHAIIAGDISDPDSRIADLLSSQDVTVRKPEQGTAPKLFYIDGSDVTLHPTAVERTPETFMWADVIPLHGGESGQPDPRPAGQWRVRRMASLKRQNPVRLYVCPNRKERPGMDRFNLVALWPNTWFKWPTTPNTKSPGIGRCRPTW